MDIIAVLRIRYMQRHRREQMRREQIRLNRVNMRHLRDVSNPFTLPDNIFTARYRLSKDLTLALIEELRPFLRAPERITGVPVQHKVTLFCQ